MPTSRFGQMTKLRMNHAGAKALLNDSRVIADLLNRANAIKDALPTSKGEKWEVVRLHGKDRTSYMVRAANPQARQTAAADQAIQRALGAGR